jgi:hypothetical protein
VSALVALGSFIIGVGLYFHADGFGLFLVWVGEIIQAAAIIGLCIRWWRHAPARLRHLILASTGIYAGAWLVIWVAAGSLAAWVLGFAAIGYVAVVAAVLATTGYFVARHAMQTQLAIATTRLKELDR